MPIPLVLALAAAGGVAGAGLGAAAGGLHMWRQVNRRGATEEYQGDIDALSHLLRSEMDLARLKREAKNLGVDPVAVDAGYQMYRDGQADLADVVKRLVRGEVPVPLIEPSSGEAAKALIEPGTATATTSEMRTWLRQNGYDVPTVGPLAQRWIDIYMEAHPAG